MFKSRLATHSFESWAPAEPTYAATPDRTTLRILLVGAHLQKYDVEFFDAKKAERHVLWPIAELGGLILSPPADWASRHPGMWRARRVVPTDRKAQQPWPDHLSTILASLG